MRIPLLPPAYREAVAKTTTPATESEIADVLAGFARSAANRGVQVVIETHSSLLLLGVQQLIASGELDPGKVWLHWFKRDDQTGFTEVTSREFDEAGRFGDWPEDFDDVTLEAQQKYLDAAEKKLAT